MKRISQSISAIAALSMMLTIAINPGEAFAGSSRQIVGSWFATISPAPGFPIPLPPINDLITFGHDGTVIESHRQYVKDNPLGFGPVLLTSGHGTWVRTGNKEFAATVRIIYQGAPDNPVLAGEIVALQKIRMKLSLSADHSTLTGSIIDQISDPNGNVLIEIPLLFSATRIQAEPIP